MSRIWKHVELKKSLGSPIKCRSSYDINAVMDDKIMIKEILSDLWK